MIFSPHHTMPPLTQVEPGTWAWPIWIWYSRLSFISIFFLFFFLLFCFFKIRLGFVRVFAFFLQRKIDYAWFIFALLSVPFTRTRESFNSVLTAGNPPGKGNTVPCTDMLHYLRGRVRTAVRCDAILSSSDIPKYTNSKSSNSFVADWDDLRFAPRKLICTDR